MASIEQSIKAQKQMVSIVRDMYATARICGWSNKETCEHKHKKLSQFKYPHWVSSYVSGVEDEIRKNLYKHDLVFGGFINGVWISAWPKHEMYYEKRGFTAQEYNEQVKDSGYYWINTVGSNPKMF